MATINPWVQFQELIAPAPRMRAEVVQLDSTNDRVKVQFVSGTRWVNGSATIGDYVLIESDELIKILPDLPFQRLEVP